MTTAAPPLRLEHSTGSVYRQVVRGLEVWFAVRCGGRSPDGTLDEAIDWLSRWQAPP